ncbi:MAG: 3-deoxy-D-manno-octulosonic acid transferase [Armatimonadetes bacterium CG_4_10_14_3_um_filter_66_18]|nr:3-deoxy-D-manno-octulosonic acid transferase [Armatimonadota bacterium]OIP04482.1 MAG: hypothetical protein AUJ96_12730 [Armatimonadetes bacterium CG2_30_66_41]PIU95576.1 MAG: 3-deoxy-D-manno-octulosonic acid transferase [Armatimonadetes bacterium CG06_land_8_20_14_3_00_66_21]PIX47311.1 MAG: 3-deoxy-D-manno-octulosonic acid transferase [Armatimonadetes bacterium CG_4_8_14_3_um_filter_66_20]PIY44439.1 MAG: 3-deoxy-D-manno-octulosonic acid transferase [Armatimonadetes bacterium CG_4_10_14_3_um
MTPYLLYNVLLCLASPLLLLYYLYKAVVLGKARRGLVQQLGFYNREELAGRLVGEPRIWVHAVSVGEVMAAAGLVEALRQELPEASLIVSTTTDTGQETAAKQLKSANALVYFPLDFAFAVRGAMKALRPDVFVMIETELWPNVLHAMRRADVGALLANGRVSDRNLKSWRYLTPFMRWLYDHVDAFAMRAEFDANRLLEQGVAPGRVYVTGEMKMDQPLQKLAPEERAELRADLRLPDDGRLLLVGSTHPGEEKLVLDAYWRIRMKHPETRLMLAPRHLDRLEEVEAAIQSHGFRPLRRTELQRLAPEEESVADRPASVEEPVLLLDTMGELARLYGACDIAYIGGSLVPRGGHNVLEPAIQGCPVLFGPHMQNFRSLAELLQSKGVAWEVATPEDLAERVCLLLGDPAELLAVEERAAATIAENRGASRRNARLIAKLAGGWRP